MMIEVAGRKLKRLNIEIKEELEEGERIAGSGIMIIGDKKKTYKIVVKK